MKTKEVHLAMCPKCGTVKAFEPGHPHLSGVCRVCLNGEVTPIAIDFDNQTFVIRA